MKFFQKTTFCWLLWTFLPQLKPSMEFRIAVRRSVSGRTGCRRCGRVDKTPRLCSSTCLAPSWYVLDYTDRSDEGCSRGRNVNNNRQKVVFWWISFWINLSFNLWVYSSYHSACGRLPRLRWCPVGTRMSRDGRAVWLIVLSMIPLTQRQLSPYTQCDCQTPYRGLSPSVDHKPYDCQTEARFKNKSPIHIVEFVKVD